MTPDEFRHVLTERFRTGELRPEQYVEQMQAVEVFGVFYVEGRERGESHFVAAGRTVAAKRLARLIEARLGT